MRSAGANQDDDAAVPPPVGLGAPTWQWAQAPGPAGPATGPPRPGHIASVALPPAVVMSAVIAYRWHTSGPGWGTAALFAGGALVVLVACRRPRLVRHLTRSFGSAVGAIVQTVSFTALGCVIVAGPWVYQRVLRIDPLDGPVPQLGSRWIRRGRLTIEASHPWAPDTALVPVSRRARRRRRVGAGAVLVAFALLVGVAGYVVSHTRFTPFGILSPAVPARSLAPPFPPETPAAFRGARWYPQHQTDIRWLWTVATAWNPLEMLRIRDVHTRTVNVDQGVRASWKPPACSCTRLRVWLYGGSTVFGLGQRDAHTIASELARAAWADGVALDIDNRGEPGWLHWQEANRYAWDSATYGPPDAVVFYDGYNEIAGVDPLAEVGDRYAPVDPFTAGYWDVLTGDARAPDPPPGAGMVPSTTSPGAAPVDSAELIVRRYDRSRRMSAATSEANGLTADWFWQPNKFSRPRVATEPESEGFAGWVELEQDLRAALDAEVHDVADALDGTRAPLFYDDVHHNEAAAALIGKRMWQVLEAKYRRLAASP
ncbi:MAG: hypothetical protein JWM47_2660 [Acidimicrobiales bacterium]|nr:hypothetical protein [Acidimicrobiales bacterium]